MADRRLPPELSFLSPEALAALEDFVCAIVVDVVNEVVAGSAGARRRGSEWLTPEEAAELLRCEPQRIYDLRSDGRLAKHGDGGRALNSRRELDAYLTSGGL